MLPVLLAFVLTAPGDVEATDKLKFTPETITVAVGGTVTWTNTGTVFHTVTGGPMNGTLAAKGATYQVTFDKAGTYAYVCLPHAGVGMKGTVVVTADAASPSVAPSAEATEDGNRQLARIDAERAAEKNTLGGFRAFAWAATAALVALSVALFASTRPRRR